MKNSTRATFFFGVLAILILSVEDSNAQCNLGDCINNNVADVRIGFNAGANLNAALLNRNTFVGTRAGQNYTNGTRNIGIGRLALQGGANATGDNNIGLGEMSGLSLTTGSFNTAVGNSALQNTTTGNNNIGIGQLAIRDNTTGSENIALGSSSLIANLSGTNNVAIGHDALAGNTIGANNVAIGQSAMPGLTGGTDNIAIGTSANNGANGNRTGTIAIGAGTIVSNTQTTLETIVIGLNGEVQNHGAISIGTHASAFGDGSISIGRLADVGNGVNRESSIAIGNMAEVFAQNSIAIGRRARVMSNNNPINGNSMALGPSAEVPGFTNSVALGFDSSPTADNQVMIGDDNVTEITSPFGEFVNGSDRRIKKEISENVAGLTFISRLRPVTYLMDKDAYNTIVGKDKEGDSQPIGRRTGFIAQEVEETCDEIRFDFHGVKKPENNRDIYGLNYSSFVVPLVKAVQEQQEMIEASEKENEALKAEFEAENQALRDELQALKAMVEDMASSQQRMDTDLQQCCFQYEGTSGTGQTSIDPSTGSGSPLLEQNQPNPFKENTIIKYYLPRSAGDAQLTVSSLDGKVLERFELDGKGFGQVLIHGGSLSPGTYIYTLEIAGQRVDSKRMVLE